VHSEEWLRVCLGKVEEGGTGVVGRGVSWDKARGER
jgi:hypothetical protein